MLPGDLPDLREKALGLARPRRVGSDAAGLRSEAVFVVGAHGRCSSENRRKQADLRLWCRSKPLKAKALRKIAARGPSKPWCRKRPPNQCADNNNFQKRPDMVPSSLILPSALSVFSAPPAGNPAGRKPARPDAETSAAKRGNAALIAFPRRWRSPRKCCRPAAPHGRGRAPERQRGRRLFAPWTAARRPLACRPGA
ncbi:hypothetical protein DES43_12716 [Aquamicrobium defluvii]|uniref:Uncharacterized protein n=1 Tax=Aquamicrobium defluvii TaxID=69279 RepID=A0A4R6YA67_9HYPH|nr:hypothetical protein DES43_12716 [Aquamicrobium defluvii]